MSPFSDEGVNLALADALDLAAPPPTGDWPDVAAAQALRLFVGADALAGVLAHCHQRVAEAA